MKVRLVESGSSVHRSIWRKEVHSKYQSMFKLRHRFQAAQIRDDLQAGPAGEESVAGEAYCAEQRHRCSGENPV